MAGARRFSSRSSLLLAGLFDGGSAVARLAPRQQLDECHKLSQTLRSENAQLKDQMLALRSQNRGLLGTSRRRRSPACPARGIQPAAGDKRSGLPGRAIPTRSGLQGAVCQLAGFGPSPVHGHARRTTRRNPLPSHGLRRAGSHCETCRGTRRAPRTRSPRIAGARQHSGRDSWAPARSGSLARTLPAAARLAATLDLRRSRPA